MQYELSLPLECQSVVQMRASSRKGNDDPTLGSDQPERQNQQCDLGQSGHASAPMCCGLNYVVCVFALVLTQCRNVKPTVNPDVALTTIQSVATNFL